MTRFRVACTFLASVLSFQAVAHAQEPATPVGSPAARTPPTAQDTPSPTPSRYSALVERVRTGDLSVDLGDLRQAYTETPEYRAMMMGVYQQLWRPLSAGDFRTALQTAETVLQRNYVEINAHMVASIANEQLGNVPRAQFHKSVADGLLRVVMSKGDGKTPETAYEVIDISEEYAVMRALNLTMKGQGLSMPPNGPKVDSLTVVDNRTKEERVLYFNVDRSMAAMTRKTVPASK
jgi:hypothetical protein